MRGGLVPRKQEQEYRGDHLVTIEPRSFLFGPAELGDQSCTTDLGDALQVLLQVALQCPERWDDAQEGEHAADVCHAACPGDELWSVGERQAEQLANHPQGQLSRISGDEVGRAALRKQVAGELVGDRTDARLHVEYRSATKRFVNNSTQPRVIRFVDGEHVVGKDAKDAGHPPAHAGNGAIVLAHGEQLAVLQHARGHLLRARHPDPTNHRESHLDHWSGCLQSSDGGGRIAEKVLAREVDRYRHGESPYRLNPAKGIRRYAIIGLGSNVLYLGLECKVGLTTRSPLSKPHVRFSREQTLVAPAGQAPSSLFANG